MVDFLFISARIKPMISKEEVKHIAKLARLGVSEAEVQHFQKDLSAILDMVGKLEEINVDNIEPTAQVTGLENKTRRDESERKEGKASKNILANAPDSKDNYIKVKAVLE